MVSKSFKLVVEDDGIGFGFFIKLVNLELQKTHTFCPGKMDNETFCFLRESHMLSETLFVPLGHLALGFSSV
jgi:hypothetical protein